MQRIEQLRRQERLHNLRALGINGGITRVWAGEVLTAGQEAAILALPFQNGDEQELQDPVTGELLYMWGLDGWGGSAPWGGA